MSLSHSPMGMQQSVPVCVCEVRGNKGQGSCALSLPLHVRVWTQGVGGVKVAFHNTSETGLMDRIVEGKKSRAKK